MSCIVCGSSLAKIYHSPVALAVSSDMRLVSESIVLMQCEACRLVQKNYSETYAKTLEALYSAYKAHPLSDGVEQPKNYGNYPLARSELIVNHTRAFIPDEAQHILDIGCGAGALLSAWRKHYGSRFEMQAFDIHENQKQQVLSIEGVSRFWSESLEKIDETYDVITMIHSLEHVPNPCDMLHQISCLLKEKGILIIQVPNLQERLVDSIIYDHLAHYTRSSLAYLVNRCGFLCHFSTEQLFGEITLVAQKSSQQTVSHTPKQTINDALSHALEHWIHVLQTLNEPIVIFGTAPIGTFCAGLCGENAICFLDEDTTRHQKFHLNKQIYAPNDYALSHRVLLPFPKHIAEGIKLRYPHLRCIEIEGVFGE